MFTAGFMANPPLWVRASRRGSSKQASKLRVLPYTDVRGFTAKICTPSKKTNKHKNARIRCSKGRFNAEHTYLHVAAHLSSMSAATLFSPPYVTRSVANVFFFSLVFLLSHAPEGRSPAYT